MKISAVKLYDGGFMMKSFACGGGLPEGAIKEEKLRSGLQNYVIDTGKEVILVDTGMPAEMEIPVTADSVTPLESGRTYYDETDVYWLSHVIYAEAGDQPFAGQLAVGNVVVNQDEDQYTENNLGVCAAQVKILLASTLGLDEDPYWDEMDAAGD